MFNIFGSFKKKKDYQLGLQNKGSKQKVPTKSWLTFRTAFDE